MALEQVEIISKTSDGLWVEGLQRSACDSCQARKGCGQRSLSQLGRSTQIWVPCDHTDEHQIGDQVTLVMPESGLIASALTLYGLPLLGLILGALLGSLLFAESSELVTFVLSMIGLAAGLFTARVIARAKQADWQPRLQTVCQTLIARELV